ncbi:hypothetical protein C8Q70DRAFT_261530 [Cubamyces menziesii]|uniref:Uncharacterized protein n=1 Tax=Trametes cubensis TaxID=1111947 RepID=A0AAD7U1W0_9APHY|nr:hypothetical protein C8Q70DRAFT_261530 [Cubamyces menziesii]KAJ8490134.1 hypothetical protein ONZ51_g2470 [Trametes cubensis]
MSTLFARLKTLRLPRVGPRSLKSQGVSIENVHPVYDCGKLAWWARWTYFLVIADLVVTASACELTFNHWTMWEELPKDASLPTTEGSNEPSERVGHYVPRPLWQRGLFTLANFAGGVGLAAVLLGGRSRIVQRMFIVPVAASAAAAASKTASERLLVIQSPLHTRGQGAVMPLSRTRLLRSPDKTEMMIGLKDRRGHYSLELQGAQVDGQKMSPWDARKALFTIWYGEKKGMQMFLNSAKVKDEAF